MSNKSPAVLVQAGGRFFYATAARLLALKFILSMSVSTHSSNNRHQQRHVPAAVNIHA
jgi:hypothetical protein